MKFLKSSLFLLLVAGAALVSYFLNTSGKNVIFISIDGLRADHLPFYGYSLRNTAPRLSELSKEGVLFERLFAAAPVTRPSLASILTGTEVATHGTLTNEYPFNPDKPSLQEILRTNRYKTAAFVSSSDLTATSGFSRGFDFYDDTSTATRESNAGDVVVKSAEQWISMHRGTKFFCWIDIADTSFPFVAPKGFRGKFADEALSKYKGDLDELKRIDKEQPELTKEEKEALIAYYDEEILSVDAVVGGLIDWLKLNALYGNTIVVIAGSHGMELYDHFKHIGSPLSLYNSVLQMPLLVLNSGISPTVVREMFGGIDIAPTLLSLLHIPIPSFVHGISAFDGHSVVTAPSDRKLVAVREPYPDILGGNAIATLSWPWKEIVFFNGPTLYLNLDLDPAEKAPLTEQDFPHAMKTFVDKWVEANYWRQAEAKYRKLLKMPLQDE